MIHENSYIDKFLRLERNSIKKVLGLRKKTNNDIIETLIGCSPTDFGKWLLNQTDGKWTARTHSTEFPS